MYIKDQFVCDISNKQTKRGGKPISINDNNG